MKTQIKLAVLAVLFSTISAQFSPSFAQGTLTPPGAPAPTMKSLAQIEPRTPIASAPFTISASGSYYLTTNVTVSSGNAITITANGVTLDLNGFTIASTAASATGMAITLGAVTNVAIYNGNISSGVTNSAAGVFGGSGFGGGINYSGNAPSNVRVKAVSVAGVLYHGINLGTDNSTVVEGCTVNEAGNYGISADRVADSTAVNCGNVGIYASTAQNCKGSGVGNGMGLYTFTANNCYGISYGSGDGLYASEVATGCFGQSSSGDGLFVTTANNCFGVSSSSYGLYANYVATGCYGYSLTGTGLYAFIASVCHDGSTSGTALSVTHNVNSF